MEPDGNQTPTAGANEAPPSAEPARVRRPLVRLRRNFRRYWAVLALTAYIGGIASGFMMWGRAPEDPKDPNNAHAGMQDMAAQVFPEEGYEIPAELGDIGPRLIEAGAIDPDRFVSLYQESGRPLSEAQRAALTKGAGGRIVIQQDNQHFLLNLFWALGLANDNPILTEGPMMNSGKTGVVNFASTGGWTLASKPVQELYAGSSIIPLTPEQQSRLEEVAQGVYRPCCDNPTHFPDCNHGMAMLGLLELMASQGAGTDEMFEAARYVNAYWFPQQMLEVALAYKIARNLNFTQADAREIVGRGTSSSSGYRAVHQWLAQNGQLGEPSQGGVNCGVK